MRQLRPILKVAALTSSILLLGGFVAYRANAFNWRSQTEIDETIISGLKSAPATTDSSPTLLETSKGGVVFPPVAPATYKPGTAFMGGSKSIVLVPPPAQAATNEPAPNQAQSAQRSE